MRIAPISYQPYVYKTNALNSNSLSRVNPIGDDLLATKTDFSGMSQNSETTNPLRRGETANFADVLVMQMQMGRLNAERIMKPAETGAQEISQRVSQIEQPSSQDAPSYQMQRAMDAYQINMIA